MAWALAYTLFRLRARPGQAALIQRWRDMARPFEAEVLEQLAQLESEELE